LHKTVKNTQEDNTLSSGDNGLHKLKF